MMPMLRMMQHGDGSLALFNGMGATELDRAGDVLAHEDTRGAPPLNAPYSGYQRHVEAGDALVIVDAGAPPPPEFSRCAHAGCLSFEYSLRHRADRRQLRRAFCAASTIFARLARATAAHSTLVIDDRSSAPASPPRARRAGAPGAIIGRPAQRGGRSAANARGDDRSSLSHDGYARDFGLIHRAQADAGLGRRHAHRASTGSSAAEAAEAAPDADFALRFHLHPRVRVAPSTDGGRSNWSSANGETLLFEAEGAAPEIEDSVFFAAPGGARKCAQIVCAERPRPARSCAGPSRASMYRRGSQRAGSPRPEAYDKSRRPQCVKRGAISG